MSNRGMEYHHPRGGGDPYHRGGVDPYHHGHHGHHRGGGDPHHGHPRGGDPYGPPPHHPYASLHHRYPPHRGGGRGRGISNAPAWMTSGSSNNNGMPSSSSMPLSSALSSSSSSRRAPPPPPMGMPPGRRNPKQGGIYFSSLAEERAWVEDRRRGRRDRSSLFDVTERKTALTKYTLHNQEANEEPLQQTRHARRLYIGHLPVELSEAQVHKFFEECIEKAMEPHAPTDPIVSVYINVDRRFAFVEFKTMELCTACLALDGINVCGKGKVKIKRPNDYHAGELLEEAQKQQRPLQHPFDVSKLGIVSGTVPDGPDKIFIGGLPYHLTEDQVMELLSAFGTVKAFHLVKTDPSSATSKGYCFVEYADGSNVTPVAVMGLNGMDMGGGKVLSARIAATPDTSSTVTATTDTTTADSDTPVPPIPPMTVVNGIDVNMLLDAAMGLRPMPTLESLLLEQQAAAASISLPTVTPAPLVAPPAPPAIVLQTRVLVLLNMVTDQDFATQEDYQGLVEDVKTECEKFGNLLSFKIPKPGDGYAESALKKIFLEYATLQDAIQAEQGLAGRSFGPAVVEATYFNEEQYASGNLC